MDQAKSITKLELLEKVNGLKRSNEDLGIIVAKHQTVIDGVNLQIANQNKQITVLENLIATLE